MENLVVNNSELVVSNNEFYVVRWETYLPNNEGVYEYGMVVTSDCPDAEDYNRADELHDCKVEIYKCGLDMPQELVEEKYFVFKPETLENAMVEFLSVVKTKVYEYVIHVNVNGRSYSKVVDEDVYNRYQAGVYTASEFVQLFFPAALEE